MTVFALLLQKLHEAVTVLDPGILDNLNLFFLLWLAKLLLLIPL